MTMLFILSQQSQMQKHFWVRQFVTCLFWWHRELHVFLICLKTEQYKEPFNACNIREKLSFPPSQTCWCRIDTMHRSAAACVLRNEPLTEWYSRSNFAERLSKIAGLRISTW